MSNRIDDLTDEVLYTLDQRERAEYMEAAEREYAKRHPVPMREPDEDDVF